MSEYSGFNLATIRRAHFIGIGGIGMSGIARLLLKTGIKVSGSDLKESEITRILKTEGARVFLGHAAANLPETDVVVTSSAVKADNPELKAALARGYTVIPRARMLAAFASSKKTITVAGSHGKTSTTSMLASALEGAKADATVVVGGLFKNISSNIRLGDGEYIVAEADESDGSFLYFDPLVACVTNIDSDHLDYYKNMENLKRAFVAHLSKIPFYGAVIACSDDPGVVSILSELKFPPITYGFKPGADWTIKKFATDGNGIVYEAWFKGIKQGKVVLRSSGRHNALNSLAALAAGKYLGFDFKDLVAGLAAFKGVKRRMEKIGECGGVVFLDDYGHHPTEIKATLAAVPKHEKNGRLIVLFQPHRYSRTDLLRKDFMSAFDDADMVYVMDIYAAGEKPIAGVNSALLLDGMKKRGVACEPFQNAMDTAKNLRSGDTFITVGAGDVWKYGEEVKLKLEAIL